MTKKMSKLNVDKYGKLASKAVRKHKSTSEIEDHNSIFWTGVIQGFIKSRIDEGEDYEGAKGFALAESLSARAITLKKYHSIYVFDESVVDFVKNTEVNKKERDKMYSVVEEIANDWMDHGVVVHLAGEDQSVIYTFSPVRMVYEQKTCTGVTGFGCFYKRFCRSDSADIGYLTITEDGGIVGGDGLTEEWRIFFNLCLYISAFPEYVIDGAPPIKIHGGRENSTTIRSSKQMREVYREGVSPHMRRGHFRFLRSARYKSKRFQAVYVKPAMIGGRANTVVGEDSE